MPKINPQTLRKFNLYRTNPELVKELSSNELADLVVAVLQAVSVIDDSIQSKKLDLEQVLGKDITKFNKEEKKAFEQFKAEVTRQVNATIKEGAKQLSETSTALEKRVAEAISNLRDGEDGLVTEEEIERAASIASSLIELPDFEKLVQTEITSNGESIRDALELLQGENRYQVEQEDVKNLQEDLKKLWDAVSSVSRGTGGGIGKGQVYRFIQQAIADGTIPSGGGSISDGDKGDITVSNSGDTWTIDDDTIGLDELSATGTPSSSTFLRGDNTWATPSGSGDMTKAVYDTDDSGVVDEAEAITGQGALATKDTVDTAEIDDEAVTLAKLQHIASQRLVGRNTAGTGDIETLTAAQVKTILSLNNVDNTADADKPISDATQTALDAKQDASSAFDGDYNSLSNKPDLSLYDNLEVEADSGDFPATGDADVLYLETNTGLLYRWNGSSYSVISAQLALGETSSTAYRGDRGKIAYDHTSLTNNPHSVTKAQVGLGNVDNTSDADKPVSTATQTALDDKQDVLSEGAFVDGDKTKLDGIESGAEANTIDSDPTGVTGADQVTNVMSLTTSEYNAITPDSATLYFITDAS